jgi:hypothetical protein
LSNTPTIPAAQVNSDWNASSGVAQILNKPTIPSALSQMTEDTTHRVVTDAEKSTWNNKQAALESGTNIKTINNEPILGSGNISIQGGEANVIESISINGTTQTITNKNVDLPVPVSVDVDTIVKVTQAAYDALATKDSSTLYLITS